MAQRGYILIYALAVLLFLTGTVTGAAYALRLGARETQQQREQLRAEFRLRGALQYTMAQFALAAAVSGGARPVTAAGGAAPRGSAPTGTAPTGTAPTGTAPPGTAPPGTAPPGNTVGGFAEPEPPGWALQEASKTLQIDAVEVEIVIEDPGGIADGNALDERMWTDYFSALGSAQPGEAEYWAAALLAWKERVGRANGRGGFASIDEMLRADALPVAVRYGGWATAQAAGSARAATPGFADLFVVGGGERVLDVNRAALPLLAAASGAAADRLASFRAARARERLTVAEAVRMLGERARPLLQETRSDPVFRVALSTETGALGGRLGLFAFVQRRNGQVQVLSWRLGPVVSAQAQR